MPTMHGKCSALGDSRVAVRRPGAGGPGISGWRALRLFASVTATLLTWYGIASAANRASVLVLSGADEELGRKLSAEAAQAGLDVVPGAVGSEHKNAATNVLRVISSDEVEMQIAAGDDRNAVTEVLRRDPAEGDSFALRVVEELRARLIELKLWTPPESAEPPPPGKPETPPPAEAPPVVTPKPAANVPADRGLQEIEAHKRPGTAPVLWPLAGIAGIAPGGGAGSSAHAVFGLRAEATETFAVTAHALVGVTQKELEGPEGSAEIQTHWLALQLGYAPFVSASGTEVEAGLGAAVLMLEMQGEAAPRYEGKETRTFAGLYFAHADVAYPLARSVRLRGSLLFGVSAPRPVVQFDDRDIAAWGRPFAGALLTAELGLPVPLREATP